MNSADRFVVCGGHRLVGETSVSGAKNAALPILLGALLCDEPCVIENVPDISDIQVVVDLARAVGADVEFSNGRMEIDPRGICTETAPSHIMQRMRASYYLLGVMLARRGRAELSMPGGCPIGLRPIDQHIKGLEALGARITLTHGTLHAEAKRLVGTEIYLDCVTVGATVNIMLAASRAEGTTVIVNAAKEPHVVDLANFLGAMGCVVKGAGTDIIRVRGVERLHGCTYAIIPDQIETGTLMIAAAATGGDVLIRGVIPTHMEAVSAKLLEMGVNVVDMDDAIRVSGRGSYRRVNIRTLPYPGFPTDLQQPFSTLLTVARGTSIITENLYEDRFQHFDQLRRMGAQVTIEGRAAIVEGVSGLSGAQVYASDLRAGAALIVAGLMASGSTEIHEIQHIDRGYERIDQKLVALGADIRRLSAQ